MSGTQTAPAHREEGRCESQAYFCVLQKGKQSSGGWGCFNGNAKWCGKKGREPSSWLQLIISSAGGWEDDSGVVKARGERWRGGGVGRLGVLVNLGTCCFSTLGSSDGGAGDSSENNTQPTTR